MIPVKVRALTGLQFWAVMLAVIAVRWPLKMLRSSILMAPLPEVFATRFSDYGLFLLLLPIGWFACALMLTTRPSTDYDPEPRFLFLAGYVILAMILILGAAGLFSALSLRSIYAPTQVP